MAKKVILVDDSKAVIATAELALEEMIGNGSIEFKAYTNPAELLAKLLEGEESFDLLLSDINMPELNGLDLVRSLKADQRYKTKPVIVLTTESSDAIKNEGKSIGVTGWMVKPFNGEKLVRSLKMVLGI